MKRRRDNSFDWEAWRRYNGTERRRVWPWLLLGAVALGWLVWLGLLLGSPY